MIITEPNELVAEVHDRMPVLLAEGDFEPWFRREAGVELLSQRRTTCCRNGPYRSSRATASAC
jgi:putative SOS response-associated peptidase YedK